MTLETFKKAVEYMKEHGQTQELEQTRKNLEKSGDQERLSLLDAPVEEPESKKSKKSK